YIYLVIPLDRSIRRSHIHHIHIDAHLYHCISNLLAATVIYHRHNHSVSVIDPAKKDQQSDRQVPCLLGLRIGGCGTDSRSRILSIVNVGKGNWWGKERHQGSAQEYS